MAAAAFAKKAGEEAGALYLSRRSLRRLRDGYRCSGSDVGISSGEGGKRTVRDQVRQLGAEREGAAWDAEERHRRGLIAIATTASAVSSGDSSS